MHVLSMHAANEFFLCDKLVKIFLTQLLHHCDLNALPLWLTTNAPISEDGHGPCQGLG